MGKYDKKNQPSSGGRAPRGRNPQLADNSEMEQVAAWLTNVKFSRKAIGGLDPVDVWEKLEELNALYENALIAERVRYNLLLRQQNPHFPEDGNGY